MHYHLLIFLVVVFISTTSSEYMSVACKRCPCEWRSGTMMVNCANQNLYEIPEDLGDDPIKAIDFSNNEFPLLNQIEFSHANLQDVNILIMQNCSIERVTESAFYDLSILRNLDLSKNKISVLRGQTFQHNIELRRINLRYNNISVLSDGLFNNTLNLREILLGHNQIEKISEETFHNLPQLREIDLAQNKIRQITFDFKTILPKLQSLKVESNPWSCDCHLQKFRQSITENEITTNPIVCDSPPRMKGKLWQDSSIFSCSPEIVDPGASKKLLETSTNTTLVCGAKGDPIPHIKWTVNGRVIKNETRKNPKYLIHENVTDDFLWSFLTITELNEIDHGDYKCTAKNIGGVEEKITTLVIGAGHRGGLLSLSVLNEGDSQSKKHGVERNFIYANILWMVGSFIVSAVVLLAMFVYFYRKKSRKRKVEKTYVAPEIVTSLMNVNPVAKPARIRTPSISADSEDGDFRENVMDEPVADNYGKRLSNDGVSYSPRSIVYTPYSLNPRGAEQFPAIVAPRLIPQYQYRIPSNYNSYTLPVSKSHPTYNNRPVIHKHGYVTLPRK